MLLRFLKQKSINSFFTPKFHYNFCEVNYFARNLHFTDVTRLNFYNDTHSLRLPARKLNLDINSTIKDFKKSSMEKYKNIHEIYVYDEDLVEFSDSTPAKCLLNENFLLKINEEWYSIISELEDPLLYVKMEHTLGEDCIYKLCEKAGHGRRQTMILSKFISSLINDLHNHHLDRIDHNIVRMIVDKNLYELSLDTKSMIMQIEMKLEVLKQKLKNLNAIKDEVDARLEFKSKRRLSRFSRFIILQIVTLQYATYVGFSWDITEPIANLLGCLELITAYVFYLATDRSFSYYHLELDFIEKRRGRKYKKAGLDMREYRETVELIEFLESEKLLFSSRIEGTVESLHLLKAPYQGESQESQEKEDLPLPLS